MQKRNCTLMQSNHESSVTLYVVARIFSNKASLTRANTNTIFNYCICKFYKSINAEPINAKLLRAILLEILFSANIDKFN